MQPRFPYCRNVGAAYTSCPQTPGLVGKLSHPRPAIAFVLQTQETSNLGPLGLSPVISISASANFGMRDPYLGSTVTTLMCTRSAPLLPKLAHLVAHVVRESACLLDRFTETGMDVFLLTPDAAALPVARAFGLPLGPRHFPRETRLRVQDFAGHSRSLPVTLHDLSPHLLGGGLQRLQFVSGTLRPGPRHVGDVGQDVATLLWTDEDEYKRVAAHQAALALWFGCELYTGMGP